MNVANTSINLYHKNMNQNQINSSTDTYVFVTEEPQYDARLCSPHTIF